MSILTQYPTGSTVYPANVTYRAVTLATNTTLVWPTEDTTSSDVVARIMDVTASSGSLALTMPPANETSTGNTVLFSNAGSLTYTVKGNGGATLLTVASGQFWTLYLTGNSTAAGVWNSYQQGTGTSSATAASLAGFGLIAITTTLNTNNPVTDETMDYAFAASDRAGIFVWGGGAGTFTLIAASGASNGWGLAVRNEGTGALILDAQGADTVNGVGSITLNPSDSAWVYSDGTSEFHTIGLGKDIAFSWSFVQINVAGTGTTTLSGGQLNQSIYEFTGVLTGNRIIQVPPTVQQYTIKNSTTGSFTLTFQTTTGTGVEIAQSGASIVYCDGTNINYSDTSFTSVPIPISDGGTGATTAAQALINLGAAGVDQAFFFSIVMG